MIISNKTLDAVIAVSNALQSISVNDKTFKENLKNLTKQKQELDKLSDDLRSRQVISDQTLQAIEDSSAELSSLEIKSDKAHKRAEKSKSDLVVQRTEVADINARNIERESTLNQIEKDLQNAEDKFKEYYETKTSELQLRETELKVKENHVDEVMSIMKRGK